MGRRVVPGLSTALLDLGVFLWFSAWGWLYGEGWTEDPFLGENHQFMPGLLICWLGVYAWFRWLDRVPWWAPAGGFVVGFLVG